MKYPLHAVRQVQTIAIPNGKYDGTWVGTQVHFFVDDVAFIADTKEHQERKVKVWVRVKDGCATVEVAE